MLETIKSKKLEIFISVALWLLIWAGYDTGIERVMSPGFPHGIVDLFHGIRAFLPIAAGVVVLGLLFFTKKLSAKGFFVTPMGLILIYSLVGIVSSTLSHNVLGALYWGAMYASVMVVLLLLSRSEHGLENLTVVIMINWIFAAALAVFLLVFFLLQPGATSSLTIDTLICVQRPYEALANIGAAPDTFGVAGTRPTGLARYAGIAVIVLFVQFLFAARRKKRVWLLLFGAFSILLFFAKGKTEIVACILALAAILWCYKKWKTWHVAWLALFALLSMFIIFYNIPCSDNINFFWQLKTELIHTQVQQPNQAAHVADRSLKTLLTLSGRVNGVWSDSWNLFLSSPLIGRGFQADRYFLNGQHAHDTLLQALVQAGILGTAPLFLAFLLTALMLCRLLQNASVIGRDKVFLIGVAGVFTFLAVRGITESLAYYSADWLFMAPLITYIQLAYEKQTKSFKKDNVVNFGGNKIDVVQLPEMVEKMEYWIKNEAQKSHWVVVTGMHGIVQSYKHADFQYILQAADIFAPDGIAVVWAARLKGFDMKQRVSGADLMTRFLEISATKNYRNFLYGDTENTLKKVSEKFPAIKINFLSPPFRDLSIEEANQVVEKINQAKPDILWVGLGLPKQEKWIFQNRDKLQVPVIIGVGAAFKFLAGSVKRAPKWMGNAGLEWLWRLFHEPKTVWKRVFFDGPVFFWLVVKDFLSGG